MSTEPLQIDPIRKNYQKKQLFKIVGRFLQQVPPEENFLEYVQSATDLTYQGNIAGRYPAYNYDLAPYPVKNRLDIPAIQSQRERLGYEDTVGIPPEWYLHLDDEHLRGIELEIDFHNEYPYSEEKVAEFLEHFDPNFQEIGLIGLDALREAVLPPGNMHQVAITLAEMINMGLIEPENQEFNIHFNVNDIADPVSNFKDLIYTHLLFTCSGFFSPPNPGYTNKRLNTKSLFQNGPKQPPNNTLHGFPIRIRNQGQEQIVEFRNLMGTIRMDDFKGFTDKLFVFDETINALSSYSRSEGGPDSDRWSVARNSLISMIDDVVREKWGFGIDEYLDLLQVAVANEAGQADTNTDLEQRIGEFFNGKVTFADFIKSDRDFDGRLRDIYSAFTSPKLQEQALGLISDIAS